MKEKKKELRIAQFGEKVDRKKFQNIYHPQFLFYFEEEKKEEKSTYNCLIWRDKLIRKTFWNPPPPRIFSFFLKRKKVLRIIWFSRKVDQFKFFWGISLSVNFELVHQPHPPGKVFSQHFSVNDGQESLQEYSRTQFVRRPQFFRQIEDNLNFLGIWKTTSIFHANATT